jgi:hypothetical protein
MSVQSLNALRLTGAPPASFGHRHFWQRALSRRAFIASASAGIGGAALAAAGVPLIAAARGTPGAPKPVPGTADIFGTPFHFNFFGSGDASTVFDFNGGIAAAHTIGKGKAAFSDKTFDVDMRIMKGEYIDLAGRHQNAAFGFI